MRRETTNLIRWVLEDLLPPPLRDSGAFRGLARLAWGRHIDDLAAFRARAATLSPEEYADLYRRHPRVHEGTDNSEACIARILDEAVGPDVCDVGCGTGYLLQRLSAVRPDIKGRRVGVEIVPPAPIPGIEFVSGAVERLPFADGAFDTVICTHVIEHVLDYRQAIAELRRIARRKLIIVVPREREYRYTFNPHFNFFPYEQSLLRAMAPLPAQYTCSDIGRDLFYGETRAAEHAQV